MNGVPSQHIGTSDEDKAKAVLTICLGEETIFFQQHQPLSVENNVFLSCNHILTLFLSLMQVVKTVYHYTSIRYLLSVYFVITSTLMGLFDCLLQW